MKTETNMQIFEPSLDHIDPSLSEFICGFDDPLNHRTIELFHNKLKSNKFVPYRITDDFESPQNEGDICIFLIEGRWIICEFGGKTWNAEATRLGYSRTNTRGTKWFNNGKISIMIHDDGDAPVGFIPGRIYTGWGKSNPSPFKGFTRAYDPDSGHDGFFETVPEGYILGVPPLKRRPKGLMPACVRLDILESKDAIINRYLAGDSTVTLGEEYNTSARTINNWLSKWGIPKRSTSRLNRPNKQKCK